MNPNARLFTLGTIMLLFAALPPSDARAQNRVRIDSGIVEGTAGLDPAVRVFKGIPYAAPPVGNLRWREPQPVASWEGVRKADAFGPRAMQGPIYSDMIFRDSGPSEDCLYLNVWTPAKSAGEKLPVMFWIHGGGFQAGSSSEPRQDGEILARKGVVVVSANYRMGVFGFLAHPELTKESGRAASGNYGIMDQIAALRWVRSNIAAFGGDPGNVTIFGESAGSFSVSLLMTSPVARGLFAKAIGQSGAFFRTRDARDDPIDISLPLSERIGMGFAQTVGVKSIAELRLKPAGELLKAQLANELFAMESTFDGYVIPADSYAAWAQGRQSHVPLLAGWNADEQRVYATFGSKRPTTEIYIAEVRAKYGDRSDAVLKLYPAHSDEEAARSYGDLQGDQFIAYSTWKWIEMHVLTGVSPVYRYSFDRKCPIAPGRVINGGPVSGENVGAVHAAEIPYVFGDLADVPEVAWQPEDRGLSDAMETYWSNFARTGNPNGPGVPEWPRYEESNGRLVQHLDSAITTAPEAHRDRYEYWAKDAAAVGK